ncbi:hypothetical protein L914_12568 [Phytophthora nicotianae]|uniref:DUF659 domain-containing protein n=1 Tax=Phytophthora nicotianae TaxID=4792 RepID=W2MZ89_PHYNI|nr:hypothetical protein L914_12568 [Phytophthora nicotianae]
MITTPAFRDFLAGVTGKPDVTVPSHKTYNDILDTHYTAFKKDVSEILAKEFKEVFETPFLNVEHDLWTNSAKSCIVGASCGFIDHKWQPRHLALLAQVKNDGHTSEEVAGVLDKELKARNGLDVNKMARFMLSDTASTARKVSKQFDSALQTDCTMHVLNLCIGYGIGLKENVRNEYILDSKTSDFVKKRLRALNNFFASSRSSERIAHLKQVQMFHRLPELATLVDADVRVASPVKLFRRSIINYPAFQAFFQNASSSDEAVFNCISQSEWELAVQLEAVVCRVAELALVESQSATMRSSTMYALLRVASTRMNSYKFLAYNLNGTRSVDTNEKNFPRVELKLTDLSELAQRCIKQTLHQIRDRIEKPSTTVAMSLLLDPRTRPSAKTFLRVPDCADGATDNILENAKTLMRVEHRVFYKAIHAGALQQNEGEATLPVS